MTDPGRDREVPAHDDEDTERQEELLPIGDDDSDGDIGSEHNSVTVDGEPLDQPAESDAGSA